jgi:hypothetical protein
MGQSFRISRPRVRFSVVVIGRREFDGGHIVDSELIARDDHQ